MAKKVLLSALFILTLWGKSPMVFADDSTDTTSTDCTYDTSTDTDSHFSVFNVLTVDECTNNSVGSSDLANEIKAKETESGSVAAALILRIINILLLVIGTFAFVTIFYAGILLVTANGEESKIDKSKSILLQSITGVVVAFLAYYIVTFVQSFFY